MPVLRLNLWSGPRNVSTGLMFAFAQRPDSRVVELLYPHYWRMSGADHPGREDVPWATTGWRTERARAVCVLPS
jgi:hypothetical protein